MRYFLYSHDFSIQMPKCTICKNSIKELFLGKLKGTIIHKPGSGRQYPVCFDCQKKFSTAEMLEKTG